MIPRHTGKSFTLLNCLPNYSSTTGYCEEHRSSSKMNRHRFIYILFFIVIGLLISYSHANEHDSLLCEESGNCAEAIHTVIKLNKRDDELAKRIAEEHGLVVKVGLLIL